MRAGSARASPFQNLFQRCGVVAPEESEFGAGKPRSVDDRGMDELVQNEDVVLADERGDRAEGRGIAGRKSERGFGGLEFSEGRLQFMMGRQRAAEEPRGAGAGAEVAYRAPRGFLEGGMGGEAQIVVRRKVQERPAVDDKLRALRRIDPAQRALKALAAQLGQFKIKLMIELICQARHPRAAGFP